MILNLFGNIFASWKANFVSAMMFPEVGKQENIDSLPRALDSCRYACYVTSKITQHIC